MAVPTNGDAGFKYTNPDTSLVVTHALSVELRELAAARPRRRYEAWSLDLTARTVVTVGDGVRDLFATVRYDTDPDGLLALIHYGIEGVALTYYPSLAITGTNYPCYLVGVDGDGIGLDRDFWFAGAWECRLHLRRTDGGTFDALLTP